VTRLEVIRPFVEQTVKEFLGVDELKVMDDGTIAIRAGSSAVTVELVESHDGGHPVLRIVSPVLRGVGSSPELLSKLNEMNAAFSFARAFVVEDTVFIAMELFAEELTTAQIEYACSLITFAADHWDDELQRSFGGWRSFEGGALATVAERASDTDEADDDALGDGGYL
jgi:type III secretion system-like peptide-binding chaperone